MKRHDIGPQPGPQETFIRSNADIVFFGGAAGGGKSFSLLLDAGALASRYNGYGAVIFRKTSVQVMAEGGLWDTNEQIYPYVGGTRGAGEQAVGLSERFGQPSS
jgi:hypothetical protein